MPNFEIACVNCKRLLERPGAILVSPPAVNDAVAVNKYNFCHACYETVQDWLNGKGML